MTHEQYLIAALLVACLAWLATAWAWWRAEGRAALYKGRWADAVAYHDDWTTRIERHDDDIDKVADGINGLLAVQTAHYRHQLEAIAAATATGKSGTARKINRMAREGLE